MIRASFEKKTFYFKRPSGTSRGVLTEKHAWFVKLWNTENPDIMGLGECSIIPGLSPDFTNFEDYETKLKSALMQIQNGQFSSEHPSIHFGIETALLDLQNGGTGLIFESKFTRGQQKLPINGLIWMGTEEYMLEQIEEKIASGFTCLKLKIGAIDFESEYAILKEIRNRYSAADLILRVDANGAFSPQEAPEKLNRLAALDIHSIEQPIQAGKWQEMAEICQKTRVPVALDEELIGIWKMEDKITLLDTIKPQYIILKPSLHGGFSGCREWISLAEERKIPWWITSALESNVGLNAIAQFTATFTNRLHQGLGTGSLYVENTPTKLFVENGYLGMEL